MSRGYPDFEGGKSKLFTVTDWSALEATDKTFQTAETNIAFGAIVSVNYTVPTGKTLYITEITFASHAYAVGNADLNQICLAYIWRYTGNLVLASAGGNGGGVITLPKPAVVPAGKQVRFIVVNKANHNCDLFITASGYEI